MPERDSLFQFLREKSGLAKLRRRRLSTWVSLDQPRDDGEIVSVAVDIADWRDNPEESYSKAELRAILAEALQGLETPLRIVFALRDMEDLSCEETARTLGLSVPAVKSRLMRARLKLRKKLSFCFNERSLLAAG